MASGDSGEVILTLQMIERSKYAEYRHTVLAGRVAAIVGVQLLVDLTTVRTEMLSQQACESNHPSCSCSRLEKNGKISAIVSYITKA